MNMNVILRAVAYAAYTALLVSWPLRLKKLRRKAGAPVLPLKRKQNALMYAVLVCAPLLIVLQTVRDFGLPVNAVLCGCALFGAEVVIRDRILGGMAGVYEHALVADGRFFLLSDITALPTLSYEDGSEQESLYARSLKVVTRTSGVVFIGFADENERNAAVDVLVKLKPELKS